MIRFFVVALFAVVVANPARGQESGQTLSGNSGKVAALEQIEALLAESLEIELQVLKTRNPEILQLDPYFPQMARRMRFGLNEQAEALVEAIKTNLKENPASAQAAESIIEQWDYRVDLANRADMLREWADSGQHEYVFELLKGDKLERLSVEHRFLLACHLAVAFYREGTMTSISISEECLDLARRIIEGEEAPTDSSFADEWNWPKPNGDPKTVLATHTFLWTLVASGQADLAVSWLEKMPYLDPHWMLSTRPARESFIMKLAKHEGSDKILEASRKFFGENPPAAALLAISESAAREGRHAEALEWARKAHERIGEPTDWSVRDLHSRLLRGLAANDNPKAVGEMLDELIERISVEWEAIKTKAAESEVDSLAVYQTGFKTFSGTPDLVRSMAGTHPVQMRRLAGLYREYTSLSAEYGGGDIEFDADYLLARLGILSPFEPARFADRSSIDRLFEDLAAAGATDNARKLYAFAHSRWAGEHASGAVIGRGDLLENVMQYHEVIKCLVARESIRFATLEEGMALLDTMTNPDSRRSGYCLLGRTLCASRPVAEVVEWSRKIADPYSRSGALMGVAQYLADVNFPRLDPEIPVPWQLSW
jgi:hypothetical protein